jgi:hypothetical protein
LRYLYDMSKRSMQEPTFLILTALAAETERRRASAAVAAQRLRARLAGGIA